MIALPGTRTQVREAERLEKLAELALSCGEVDEALELAGKSADQYREASDRAFAIADRLGDIGLVFAIGGVIGYAIRTLV